MGTLSLCADSARPPGMTTRHAGTKGNGMTTGNRPCAQRHCSTRQSMYPIHDEIYPSTTYYKNTTPPSQLTPFSPPGSSLHDISVLTPPLILRWHLFLLLCLPIVTFLLSQLRRQRTSKSINKINLDQTNKEEAVFLSLRARNVKNRKRTRQRPAKCKREKFPKAKIPGSRPKRGKTNAPWNIVYDPANDQILIWRLQRVRIYCRKGRRLFVYKKGKSENTFPRHSLPVLGIWQGSYFIISTITHWTHQPTSDFLTHSPIRTLNKTGDQGSPKTESQLGEETNVKHAPTPNDPSSQKTVKSQPLRHHWTITTHTSPTNISPSKQTPSRQNNEVSHTSNEKWQNQERTVIVYNWTPRHRAAYLAIPEVALEWNFDPGSTIGNVSPWTQEHLDAYLLSAEIISAQRDEAAG